ncbi:MAG TPA: MltA domain-containing protein [Desulfovibrio sp.]|uniref:MltA domain-containing protein n=1 Tax=Desulfovibrio TaxID=872 RepID=UPI002A4DBFB5|nr:MltA domain-containing protein [Desulfovibrio sp.]MDY0307322.1 MltA domain-containing protein [Desulfovibrionaceae bacterium]HMM37886.1 MltA domain-containing protein [Desulfovibrio sp.]
MRARLIRLLLAGLACVTLAACAELQLEPDPPAPAPQVAIRTTPPPAPPVCPAPAPASREAREPAPSASRAASVSGSWFDLRAQGLSSWNDLRTPLQRSLAFLESRPAGTEAVRRGCFRPTWGQLAESARELLELLPRLDAEPQLLAERFLWLAVQPGPVMTAYYTPEIPASLTRRKGYEHPLYGPPPELAQADEPGMLPAWPGAAPEGPARGASDSAAGTLAGRGLEIAWARDPLDVFFMQVEGSGILRLPDGRHKTAQYAASNGRRFRSLGDILAERGLLAPEQRSRKAVRRFFRDNPHMARELMAENRRFVFFRLDDGPPVGALGKPLTPFVSVATDPNLLPLGSVLILEAETPDPSGRGTRRIRGPVLPQDVGSAIKGARLDFYMGEGGAVEEAADRVKNRVTAYMLLSKSALVRGSR